MKIEIPTRALSVNKAWSGQRFKSCYYKEFENEINYLLKSAKKTITCECEVHYSFYIKNYKQSDVDNMIKTIQDQIIKKGYLKDDQESLDIKMSY